MELATYIYIYIYYPTNKLLSTSSCSPIQSSVQSWYTDNGEYSITSQNTIKHLTNITFHLYT